MKEKFERIIPYYGKEKFETLQSKKVLVFGLGGVGGYVVDGLIRNGILNIGICDGDKVELSNFNRQIIALESNLNKQKVNAMEERILDINSDVNVTKYDLIIDCIDDVKAKIMIIEKAKLSNVEIISCMGTANKNDPNAFKIVDINQTSYCPLAKKVRTELKKKNISNVKVCFSNEVINNNSNVLLSPLYVVASSSYVILKEAIKVLLSD